MRIKQVSGKVSGGQGAVFDEQGTAHHNDDIHQSVKDSVGGTEGCHVPIGKSLQLQKSFVALVELLFLNIFIGEGLDHPNAQQAILHLGIDFAYLSVAHLKGAAHFLIVVPGENHHQGHHGKHHQSQGHIHAAENHKAGGNLHRCNEELFRAVVGKFRYFKQVGCNPSHDLPHLGFAVVAEGQLLQVMEQIRPHVVFQLGAHNVTHGLHEIIGQCVNHPKKHIGAPKGQDKFQRQGGKIRGGTLGNGTHQHGQYQFAHRGKSGAAQVKGHRALVFTEIGEKTPDQLRGFHNMLALHRSNAPFLERLPLYHRTGRRARMFPSFSRKINA